MARDYISAKKSAQGYRAPSERDGCRNCRHRSPHALRYDGGGRIAYDCQLGKFLVSPTSICNNHQRAGIAGLPRKEGAPA